MNKCIKRYSLNTRIELLCEQEKSIVLSHSCLKAICPAAVSLTRLQMSETELDPPTQIPAPTNLLYLGNSLVIDALLHSIAQNRRLNFALFLTHTFSIQARGLGSLCIIPI